MTRPLALAAAILTLACDAGVVGVRDWTRVVVVDTTSIEATLGGSPPRIWVTANADREWLEALYEATDGDNWKRRDNWLTDAPLGEWHGVRTDSAGRVIVLWMYDNGLRGVIPPETGYLGRLEELGLPGNQLWGAIPPSLGHLAALERLILWGNHLSGPIPPELARLRHLRTLGLADNYLLGPIPPELGALESLEELDVEGNHTLTGPIPPALGALGRLRNLNVSRTGLSGGVPPDLGELSALSYLSATNSSGLSGPLPLTLTRVPLTGLFVAGTGLCAPTDSVFAAWLASIPNKRIASCAGG